MYDTVQWDYFWPNVVVELYETVSSCQKCVGNSIKAKHRRYLHLFPATDPLKLVAMDILDSLPKSAKENLHVITTTGLYSKITKAAPTARIITNTVAEIIMNVWVTPYGKPG